MKGNPEDLQQRMDRFEEALRRSGVKVTHQRLEIFRQVAMSRDHPDVETVYRGVRERMPTVSLDTVYRTLRLLLGLGLLDTLGLPRRRVRFDADVSAHHHFVCTRCGTAHDFRSDEFNGLRVPEAVKALGSVERMCVQFRGLCLRCSRREGRKQSARA